MHCRFKGRGDGPANPAPPTSQLLGFVGEYASATAPAVNPGGVSSRGTAVTTSKQGSVAYCPGPDSVAVVMDIKAGVSPSQVRYPARTPQRPCIEENHDDRPHWHWSRGRRSFRHLLRCRVESARDAPGDADAGRRGKR